MLTRLYLYEFLYSNEAKIMVGRGRYKCGLGAIKSAGARALTSTQWVQA